MFFSVPVLCDPLHKVGQEGAWQHEQSGWIFPKQIGEFERINPPYEIDGTYDVGAAYERLENGSRTRATVHIYAQDSAAVEADFSAAKRKFNNAASDSAAVSEAICSIEAAVVVTCRKLNLKTDAATKHLYFVETNEWVVNIRTIADTTASASASTDRFVSELHWNTLGTVPDLHTPR